MITSKLNLKILVCIAFFLISQSAICQTSWDYRNTTPKNQFPKFRATIDSVVYSNETIAGKIVFMNFWRSNCSPCIAEINGLNTLYRKLKDRKDFIFISFTPDDPEFIEMLIDKHDIKFPVLSLSEKYIKTTKFVKGYPTSLILNEKGEVIYSRPGGSSSDKEATKIIKDEIFPQIKLALEHKPLKVYY